MTPEVIARIQQAFELSGHDPSPVNEELNVTTQETVGNYQKRMDWKRSGYLLRLWTSWVSRDNPYGAPDQLISTYLKIITATIISVAPLPNKFKPLENTLYDFINV